MQELKTLIITVTPFQQNCALIWSPETNTGVVVDPGGDVDDILSAISEQKVNVERILLTHGHIDHVGGAADLAKTLKVPVEGPHRDDMQLIEGIENQARMFGVSGLKSVKPDKWLSEGDSVMIADVPFNVLHCPGHSPGHVVFFNGDSGFAILGDVLFNGSIGRTDLPGGDYEALLSSIKDKLLPLGDHVNFICGHGPASTIGHERQSNPFLTGM